jgi:hypothetical protein
LRLRAAQVGARESDADRTSSKNPTLPLGCGASTSYLHTQVGPASPELFRHRATSGELHETSQRLPLFSALHELVALVAVIELVVVLVLPAFVELVMLVELLELMELVTFVELLTSVGVAALAGAMFSVDA